MNPDQWIADKLAECETLWKNGIFAGLLDAIHFASDNNRPLPEWVWKNAHRELLVHFIGLKEGTRGRTGSKFGKVRTLRTHFIRWSMVSDILRSPSILMPGHPSTSIAAASREASKRLRRTPTKEGWGEPEAIQKSYRVVQKAMDAGRGEPYRQSVEGAFGR